MSSRKILNSFANMLVVTLIALLAGCSDKPQEAKEQPNLKDIAHLPMKHLSMPIR
jgi:hypothetical protein